MKAGLVTSIRVNPKDCMSIIDVLNAGGVNFDGMSFASMTSLALSSLLETSRKAGLIPTRDGFEYLTMMQPYISKQNGRKLAITAAMSGLGGAIKAPVVERQVIATPEPDHQPAPVSDTIITAEIRTARRRLTELLAKKDMVDGGSHDVTWSASDEQEYKEVYAIVYPEG